MTTFNVLSGDMRQTVEAGSHGEAARIAVKQFHDSHGDGAMLGRITSISTDGWPGERDYRDDDYLMSTTSLLDSAGLLWSRASDTSSDKQDRCK